MALAGRVKIQAKVRRYIENSRAERFQTAVDVGAGTDEVIGRHWDQSLYQGAIIRSGSFSIMRILTYSS